MCENLLSFLHIQKLGHPIEEIRLRALSSVITKYNLNLVDKSNLENTKLLLEKLLNWFSFEKYSEEEKVLNLLLQIFKYDNADLILNEINANDVLKKLKEIEKKLDLVYSPLIQELKYCILKNRDDLKQNFCDYTLANGEPEIICLSDTNGCEYQNEFFYTASSKSNYTDIPFSGSSGRCNLESGDSVKIGETNTARRQHECNEMSQSLVKVEYFPWQHLVPGDKHVLSSVYDGLRYIDNNNSILQSCQFFNEVVLRDFPTEIFIQRPLIVRTFLQLIECVQQDIRIPVIKCLINVIKCLKKSIQCALNASVLNLKQEFYSTNMFSDDVHVNGENSECSRGSEFLPPNLAALDEDSENEENDHNLKKYQLSVNQFCFEVLFQVLPYLKQKSSQEEINFLILLSYETLSCLMFNIKSDIWNCQNDVKDNLYKIFSTIQELLKYHKERNQVIYVTLLYIIIKLLNFLKPPSGLHLSEILPLGLHSELGSCITNSVLVLIFPWLHSEILKYVEQFLGQREKEIVQDYKDVLLIFDSMKSSVTFLKQNSKLGTKMEKLECVNNALSSLDFHQNVDLIHSFVNCCLVKWNKCQLKEEELKTREIIILKLLSHSNNFIKINAYQSIHKHAMKLLGIDEAVNPKYEFPGDKMDFLFQNEVLTEVISFGLNSSLAEIRKYSNEIITLLLKSKFIMSEDCWGDFISALVPCLSLLQCFADKSTPLGRCIVKMFDPDVAKSIGLPLIEVLKGNIRFLFSKDNLTRDEAIPRLFWLLSREDLNGKKLPRMSVLTGMNLSGICSSVKPQEFTKIRQSFYDPGRLCDVIDMLGSDNVEPNIRRSALSQISVMMDDVHLHSTFLEQKGLKKILEILNNCLIEKEFRNYPDSVIPIVDILKLLSLHNVCVRQELSAKIDVYYSVLRGLFLFSSDDIMRRNSVELLCLLLYSDCVLRVPLEKSINCTISFPEIIVSKMCLPLLTNVHGRNSKHWEPSIKKILMGKEGCSKLIRLFWTVQWVGSLPDVLSMESSDLKDKSHSPGIPNDLKASYDEIEDLRKCAFGLSVKRTLYNIQNATTHETVFYCLQKLHSYFLLYKIDKATSGKKCQDIGSDKTLSHMLWESTFQRFMTSTPTCVQDESLLLQVIQFIQLLLGSFKSERLINWVEKLVVDENQPVFKILKKMGTENHGLNALEGNSSHLIQIIIIKQGRELRLGIIELIQQVVSSKSSLDTSSWFIYVDLISRHLKLENKDEFYNVAYVDWLASLLVDLTGKWKWNFAEKTKFLENLIIRIMEMIIAFHCTKDSVVSFMGINILKNSLLILNHIITDSQSNLKKWEELWYQALSKVIGHVDVNYCWLLSLWFMRNPIVRAAAFQLFVAFSVSPQSCELLIDRLNIQYEHIWTHGLKILFDDDDCCFVREKSSLLLSNFASHGYRFSSAKFLQHLDKVNFYMEVSVIVSYFQSEPYLEEVKLHQSKNVFDAHTVTTPSFVTSLCVLMLNVVSLDAVQVSEKVLESGALESFMRALGDIPESTNVCELHQNCVDVLQMYISICRLISRCSTDSGSVHSFLVQSQQTINYFFSMIDHNLYCEESKTITAIKSELWCEILDLFSTLLVRNVECSQNAKENAGFVALNRCMSENGVDNFISSLYIALTSDVSELRLAVLNFFINLLYHEMSLDKNISVSDIFVRKITGKALKLATRHGWKGFTVSENLSLTFGIRLADILLQMLSMSNSCFSQSVKNTIANALGSLLAVCEPAQNFCIERDLAVSLVTSLKQLCMKLNLENVDSLKRMTDKKRISPLLVEVENLLRLIGNLLFNNKKAKTAVAGCALTSVVHKLWPWCIAKQSLHVVTLKMLCTFTCDCDQSCRTLAASTNLLVLALKKLPGSVTLLNAVKNQIAVEMDLISKTHDSLILCLCLQVLSNCCRVTDCRSVISKDSFLQEFTKLHPSGKKRGYGDTVVQSWLKFFVAFSSCQEGQLALTKNQEVLDLIIMLSASSKPNHKLDALTVLRNVCFHQLNRVRLLSSCSFLSLVLETLNSKKREEVQSAAVMVWSLSCNAQKAKLILRNAGFESKLETAKRTYLLNEDKETVNLIEVVLRILRNK